MGWETVAEEDAVRFLPLFLLCLLLCGCGGTFVCMTPVEGSRLAGEGTVQPRVFREDETAPSGYVVLCDMFAQTDGGHRMPTLDMAVRALRDAAADIGAEAVVGVVGGVMTAGMGAEFSWASGIAVVFDETSPAQSPLETSVAIRPIRNEPEDDEPQKEKDEGLLLPLVRYWLERQGYETLLPSRSMADVAAPGSGDQPILSGEHPAHLLLEFTVIETETYNVLLSLLGATAVVRTTLREAESGDVLWEQETTASSPGGLLAVGMDHRAYALILAANEVFKTLPPAPSFMCPAE